MNSCSVNSYARVEPFSYSSDGLGVELAMQLTKGGGTREYEFINAVLSDNIINVSNLLMSDKATKSIFDSAMNQISHQDDVAAAAALALLPKALDKMSIDERKAKLLEMRATGSIDVGTCAAENMIGKVGHLNRINKIDGVYYSVFAEQEKGFFADSFNVVGGTQLTNCWSVDEKSERSKIQGSEIEAWDKLHERWIVEPNADLSKLTAAGEADSPCKRSMVGCVFNGMFHATASIKSGIDSAADTVFAPLNWLTEKLDAAQRPRN